MPKDFMPPEEIFKFDLKKLGPNLIRFSPLRKSE